MTIEGKYQFSIQKIFWFETSVLMRCFERNKLHYSLFKKYLFMVAYTNISFRIFNLALWWDKLWDLTHLKLNDKNEDDCALYFWGLKNRKVSTYTFHLALQTTEIHFTLISKRLLNLTLNLSLLSLLWCFKAYRIIKIK